MSRTLLAVCAAGALVLGACDQNIGGIFDTGKGGGGGGGTGVSNGIVVVPDGGKVVDGRPKVVDAFPNSGGWPTTVPIVVVFNESISRDSVTPPGGGGPGGIGGAGGALISIQIQDGGPAVPADVTWLVGDTVAVLRPAAPLQNDAEIIYEVTVDPEVRDIDNIRKGGTEPEIVATFTTGADETNEDGRILTVLPLDNEREATRESDVWAVFSKLSDESSWDPQSFFVRAGGVDVAGGLDAPIRTANVPDTRFLRFRPQEALPSAAQVEVFAESAIRFGQNGTLDNRGRAPYSVFTTVPVGAPARVAVGNAPAGFPGAINESNLSNLQVDVDVDSAAAVGDRVIVRVYGLDPEQSAEGDVIFVEGSADLAVAGESTVNVMLGDALGTIDRPRFDEGTVTVTAQLRRGREQSAFASSDNPARFDVTAPTLMSLAPSVGGGNDVATDIESIAFYGTASERIAAADLVIGGTSVALFASDDSGGFVFEPLVVDRLAAPLGYMLVLTDAAGNMTASTIDGSIVQRGVVTGPAAASLTVEVWDEATFEPVVGATVVVDPGMPSAPVAAGRQIGATGADGRAAFSGLSASTHSITVVADGYHLTTLLDANASFASLPIRPLVDATATLAGTVGFLPSGGQTALVGSNGFANPRRESVATASSNAIAIPDTLVLPGRPQVLTALVGTFEPTALPAFSSFACQMCGPDGATPSAPEPPIAAGGRSEIVLTALPAATAAVPLSPAVADFAASTGLGTLPSAPTVRVLGSMVGFGGNTLFGAGFAASSGGSEWAVQASYAFPMLDNLVAFGPQLWISTEATDGDGNVARRRELNGFILAPVSTPGIPTITPPGGPSNGSPQLTYQDHLDPAVMLGGIAVTSIRATDAAGRSWTLLRRDVDGAGGAKTLQLPILSGLAVQGLQTGSWSVAVESELAVSLTATPSDYTIAELRRFQLTWARARSVSFEVR